MAMSIEQAEVMLLRWGQWQRGNSLPGESGINILYRCQKEGAGAAHSTVTTEPHMPRIVEIVEACCLTMPKPMLRAVKHRYIGNEPDGWAAKKMRVTVDVYQSRINQAVHFLDDFVTVY